MPEQIIGRIIYDELTGIPFLEDVHGVLHMAGDWFQAIPIPATRHYVQTLSHLEFPNVTEFHSIPNELTGEPTTEYTIPVGKTWYPAFIMASQDELSKKPTFGKSMVGMSIVGVYIDDVFTMAIPFRNDLHYVLYEPLSFPAGVKVEFKLMPHHKNTRVCVMCGGELRDID
jgi:hypothetical protein